MRFLAPSPDSHQRGLPVGLHRNGFGKKRSPFHEWNAFGDSEKIEGSRHDPFHLADEIAEHSPQKMPKIYLSCGTEDELIAPAREFRDYPVSKRFVCTYYEEPGRHD